MLLRIGFSDYINIDRIDRIRQMQDASVLIEMGEIEIRVEKTYAAKLIDTIEEWHTDEYTIVNAPPGCEYLAMFDPDQPLERSIVIAFRIVTSGLADGLGFYPITCEGVCECADYSACKMPDGKLYAFEASYENEEAFITAAKETWARRKELELPAE